MRAWSILASALVLIVSLAIAAFLWNGSDALLDGFPSEVASLMVATFGVIAAFMTSSLGLNRKSSRK